MPDEYISRAEALRAVQKQRGANRSPAQNAMLDRICCDIKNRPAADVAPVVHGQWDAEGDGYADGEIVLDVWYCSECGYCIDDGTDNPDCLPKYCTNCGARMDGAAE